MNTCGVSEVQSAGIFSQSNRYWYDRNKPVVNNNSSIVICMFVKADDYGNSTTVPILSLQKPLSVQREYCEIALLPTNIFSILGSLGIRRGLLGLLYSVVKLQCSRTSSISQTFFHYTCAIDHLYSLFFNGFSNSLKRLHL